MGSNCMGRAGICPCNFFARDPTAVRTRGAVRWRTGSGSRSRCSGRCRRQRVRTGAGCASAPGIPSMTCTTFSALLKALHGSGLAYLHMLRRPQAELDNIALARHHFDGPLLLNESYTLAEAAEAISTGDGEAVSFARLFVSNPDLVRLAAEGGVPVPFDRRTLYTPGAAGYIDY